MSKELEKLLANVTTEELKTLLNQKEKQKAVTNNRIDLDNIDIFRAKIKENNERNSNRQAFRICGGCGQVITEVK